MIIIVAVIAIIGALLYVSLNQRPISMTSTQQNNTQSVTPTPVGSVSSSNPQDTSDAAINSDLSAIDIQMNGLTVDSNNVNQSVNNQ